MIPINNSDTAWLIVSDYNQDNSKHYEYLREDVLNPDINLWIDGGDGEINNIGGGYFLGVGNGLGIPGDYCPNVGDSASGNIGGYSWLVGQVGG